MKRQTLNCNGRLVCIDQPIVMGILNVTPDSFFDGGRYATEVTLIKRCETIITEGGAIIDVGAYSSRPGATMPDAEEERRRLEWALTSVRRHFPDVLISVDTCRADIARLMVEKYGVDIINDISAGTHDADMYAAVASLHVPYVMMHMQGTPETMQENPIYSQPMLDIMRWFAERLPLLREAGIMDVVIDPGFGFGKTVDHNYAILASLPHLQLFEMPVLVGVSRKRMIYTPLGTDAQHALNGTTAVNTLALAGGADILRVHDVKEAVECVKIAQLYRKHQQPESNT